MQKLQEDFAKFENFNKITKDMWQTFNSSEYSCIAFT